MKQFPIDKFDWQQTGDPRYPWSAKVSGSTWQLRVNEFPEANYLYTLLVDGIETAGFNQLPQSLQRPTEVRGGSQEPANDETDMHELAQYEAETEWANRSEQIKPSGEIK